METPTRLPKIFRSKWLWLIGLPVVILLFFLFWIPRKEVKESRPEKPAVEAKTLIVRLEEIPVYREATGVVTSVYESTLGGKVTGLVENIRVREGDRVQAGEILVTLDNRDLQAQLDRAQAELENATIHYQRMKQLFSEDSVAKQELDNTERAYKVAEATKKAIEADLSYTVIKAPFDGVITEKMIEMGEMVTPGRPLLRLEDDRHLRLESTVSETDIAALHIGDRVTIRLDALRDREVMGQVTQIFPAADPSTHSFEVKVALTGQAGLKSGLFGRMFFPIGSKKTVRVPRSAVLEKGALSYLYVVNESGWIESRLVKLGNLDHDRIEVLSGLEPEEQILEHPVEGYEGTRIRPIQGDRS